MGKPEDIIAALGGADNIEEIEACATRLRTVVDDPSLVEAGAAVELEGRPLSGGRFNPTKVTVTLKEPLKSQEYFAAEDKAK